MISLRAFFIFLSLLGLLMLPVSHIQESSDTCKGIGKDYLPLATKAYGLLNIGGLAPTASLAAAETDRKPPRIEIPLKTWIAKKLAKRGEGPCPGGGCKHMRLTHNPDNGRIYFLGGDYSGPIGMQSGRNELYSYSIAEDHWRLEFPYCGPAGSVQPSHPDEVGWVYDTKRKIFWMVPGYMGNPQKNCPESTLIRGKVMTFDPATQKWEATERTRLKGTNAFAQYDPATDTIVMFTPNGAAVYDVQSDKWTNHRFGLGQLDISHHYSAIALEKRVIYAIAPHRKQLLKYDMDRRTAGFISDAPPYEEPRPADAMPIWDSVNKVLLFPQWMKGVTSFHVYHPDTNTWERNIPINQPEGITVTGRQAVFDPYQNVLLLMGSTSKEASPHLFLYRYGNGQGLAR